MKNANCKLASGVARVHVLVACGVVLSAVCLFVLPGCKPEELGAAHPTTNDYYDSKFVFAPEPKMAVAPKSQTVEEVQKKSRGCMSCHKGIENPSMHESPAVKLGCTDCHGGNGEAAIKEVAHVQPRGHWYGQGPATRPERKSLFETTKDTKSTKNEPKGPGAGAQGSAAVNCDPNEEEKKKEAEPKSNEAHAEAPHTAHGGHGGHGGHGHGGSANPRRSYTAWQMESAEFVRFVNPGDLRVARYSCGECHAEQVVNTPHSMMAHGAMLWNAALYNNGGSNQKYGRFGEAYMIDGQPARLRSIKWEGGDQFSTGKITVLKPTEEEIRTRGVLPFLDPLPRYNITQPGNILRVFERGGKLKLETSLPDKDNEPGKPESKLSVRGIGTGLSTDPVFLGLQKTRLLDPVLWQLGTNDQAGDYRSSGCTACHVLYANDRDPAHSGQYAQYGKDGHSFTSDEALKDIVKKESGHPIKHAFTKSIPSSQCVVCHMHPGTTVTMTYYGNLWYDNETEGQKMYPKTQLPKKSEREEEKIKVRNPEGSALRGNWGNLDFLEGLADRNSEFKQIQFADYNGHGWVFRNVYKQDKYGTLLDVNGKPVAFDSPHKFKKGAHGEPIPGSAVHMQDIHQEKGMHCIDCHFNQDNHGNGKLYGEVRNATEITCVDCHGTISKTATLKTTGNAAPDGGTDLSKTKVFGRNRFTWEGAKLFQQSAINPDLKWEVKQTAHTVTPGHPSYNEKARLAKTMRRDGKTWGNIPEDPNDLAHSNDKMDCYVCHTSWVASCFGCHLPMKSNQARFNNHYEGGKSRNWTQYNFQTLREDIFMLGVDGTVKKNKVAPVRSTCAVVVGSQNAQREWVYSQQQTVSAEGFSGQAFSPHFPHAVRSKETKNCTDCHVSSAGDNNAQMAQLLMQGTNQTNFMFRYVYVASGKGGVNAVAVTEAEEPQAVIGSTLHRDAYPEEYAAHKKRGDELTTFYEHPGNVLGVQLRGEYLYAARGKDGLQIYDVANIDNKGFSERITTAPVSPLGQRFFVKSRDCTSVVSPTVLGVDPTRQPPLRPRDPLNQEQPISLTYAFLYCTDSQEGLFTVLAGTLLDGDPTNNFLRRHMTFNPDGILRGAVNAVVAGNYIYVCCDAGLVIVDISKIGTELAVAAMKMNPDGTKSLSVDDLQKAAGRADPNLLKVVSVIPLKNPKSVRVQFRYAFVVDDDGLKTIDITEPEAAKAVEGALVPLKSAHSVYLARTYAYVGAGAEGMAIIDIERPAAPKLAQMFNADGHLNDVRDVKIGMTNASAFAYVANGHNGLAIVQLTSPESSPGYLGWAAKPNPQLIATKHLHGTALGLSEGLQRDRGVDESGNQLSVFNRVGSRPLNKSEMDRMYKINGKLFTVSNEPPGEPLEMKRIGPDPVLAAEMDKLKADLARERNPARKRTIQQQIDELQKKIDAGGGGPDPEKIKDLELQISRERNPAKKKKLQEDLDALKKGGTAAPTPPVAPPELTRIVPPIPGFDLLTKDEKMKYLEDQIKRENNPSRKKQMEKVLEELKVLK